MINMCIVAVLPESTQFAQIMNGSLTCQMVVFFLEKPQYMSEEKQEKQTLSGDICIMCLYYFMASLLSILSFLKSSKMLHVYLFTYLFIDWFIYLLIYLFIIIIYLFKEFCMYWFWLTNSAVLTYLSVNMARLALLCMRDIDSIT